MEFTSCQFTEFLKDSKYPLVFAEGIDNIYLGYRQCYSKNPHVVKELTPEDMQQLKQEYEEYLHWYLKNDNQYKKDKNLVEKRINDMVIKLGEKEFFTYLYKCKFISEYSGHQSPIEHASLTVRITNVSRAMTHQHVRHRIASYSHQSQRYVSETDPIFIIPPSIENNSEAKAIYEEYLGRLPEAMRKIKALGDKKIQDEDIRFMYPNAMATEIVTTMNLRSWMHYFNERCCVRAQWEIRSVAEMILDYLQDHIPFVFRDAGPKCMITKTCPEPEKFACGRFPRTEVVVDFHERFKHIVK